ncbi:MAG: L-threonylcarbamoyladenylate synthase [Ahrensia sp.]|nr:L-threonylcarbamoyladenylate synthase [Ahrensia sp.]
MSVVINLAEEEGRGLREAAKVLRSGGLVGVPTETVYGLAADATNTDAVVRIYAAKGRPSHNPLIAHVSNLDMAQRYGAFGAEATTLAASFWPGPLTLVVPRQQHTPLAPQVSAGLPTVALRRAPGAMALLSEMIGGPIAAPSANSSGRISPTTAEHVIDDLGAKVDLVLDGGACAVGLESTVVKCDTRNVTLLREGGVEAQMLEALIGPIGTASYGSVEAPGMLLKHYAPSKPLRLNATESREGEALLAFGPESANATLNLSVSGDVTEAARNLFAMLRELDAGSSTAIAVQNVPEVGIGVAINDRLRRAAAGAAG